MHIIANEETAGEFIATEESDGQFEGRKAYYQYSPRRPEFKRPPVIDPYINEELGRIGGADEYGHPLFRVSWLGSAVVRDSETSNVSQIFGPTTAFVADAGDVDPDWNGRALKWRTNAFKFRSRVFDQHCFRVDGEVVRVDRPELIPPTVLISWCEATYTEYGALHFSVDRKLTPDQLVEAGIYRPDDPELPGRGDYISLITVKDEDGGYLEPTRAWLEAVRESFHDSVNGDNVKLRERRMAEAQRARDYREQKQDEYETQEFYDAWARIEAEALRNRSYFFYQ